MIFICFILRQLGVLLHINTTKQIEFMLIIFRITEENLIYLIINQYYEKTGNFNNILLIMKMFDLINNNEFLVTVGNNKNFIQNFIKLNYDLKFKNEL